MNDRHFAICNLQRLLRALCALCGYLSCAAAQLSAAELVRVQGEPVDTALQAVNFEAITFVGQEPFTLPMDELVRWGDPVEPRPQIVLVLSDGGRLVTAPAWSGGAPLRLDGEHVIALTEIWGEERVPRPLVRGFVFAQRQRAGEREKLERLVRAENADADIVLLTNQDRVMGQLTALAGGSLTLETEVGPVKLPLSRVKAVILGSKRTESTASPRPRAHSLAVGTTDGSLVYASIAIANANALTIDVVGGIRLEGGNVEDVVLLQSLGGQFVYLSNLEPDGYRHVPYLSIEWPYQRDRNVLGEPLSVGGKRYVKGIGMHSAARLTYRLNRKYQRFDSTIAIDDSADGRGSVTFGVYVLRDGQWQEAFTSGILRGGEAPQPLSVDVTGADGLTLTVDYADRGDEMDRANWLDARLVKAGDSPQRHEGHVEKPAN
jgi:hypothetical protein